MPIKVEEVEQTHVVAKRTHRERTRTHRRLRDGEIEVFLMLLAAGEPVRTAATVAGRPLSTLYARRARDCEFAAAWADALEAGCAAVEAKLRRWVQMESPDGLPTIVQVRAAEVLLKAHRGPHTRV